MIPINQDTVLEIKPALNGYIVERGEYTKNNDGITSYQNGKTICNTWEDVVEYVTYNKF